jgi:hypothetical protein
MDWMTPLKGREPGRATRIVAPGNSCCHFLSCWFGVEMNLGSPWPVFSLGKAMLRIEDHELYIKEMKGE